MLRTARERQGDRVLVDGDIHWITTLCDSGEVFAIFPKRCLDLFSLRSDRPRTVAIPSITLPGKKCSPVVASHADAAVHPVRLARPPPSRMLICQGCPRSHVHFFTRALHHFTSYQRAAASKTGTDPNGCLLELSRSKLCPLSSSPPTPCRSYRRFQGVPFTSPRSKCPISRPPYFITRSSLFRSEMRSPVDIASLKWNCTSSGMIVGAYL